MNIAEAFKKFFLALNGIEPTGDTISEVVRKGTVNVENVSSMATRLTSLEGSAVTYDDVSSMATRLTSLEGSAVTYDDEKKSFVLNSSTTDSTKKFNIIVLDNGTITATEIVDETEE